MGLQLGLILCKDTLIHVVPYEPKSLTATHIVWAPIVQSIG